MKIKLINLIMLLLVSMSSSSAVFDVNNFADRIDVNPGDGVCEATAALGDCTLRAAINETNALIGNDTINLPEGTFVLSISGIDDSALMGDLDSTFVDLTISGAGINQTIIDGGGIDRIFHFSQSNVTLEDLTLQNGGDEMATNLGGAILYNGTLSEQLILNRVKVDSNRSNAGAGMYIVGTFENYAQVSIIDSVFSNNSTTELGATNRLGPAIFCISCDLKAKAMTISENGIGGKAIRIEKGSLEMINSTISHNQEGGVRSTNADILIKFSTFFENGAQDLSFFSFDDSHVFQVGYSVLQTSTTDNCQSGDLPVSLGYNVTSDSSCEFTMIGDAQSTDAQLGLLANNGGLSQTHLPAMTSPLINQVPLAECLDNTGVALIQDQRGFDRPVETLCDIGAVEVNNHVIFRNGFE